MGAVSTFLNLPIADQGLALEAACTVAGVAVMLRCLPYRSWRGAMAPSLSSATPSPAQLATARRVGKAVAAVARNLPGKPQCLAQALSARAMLRRRGIASALSLGVNKNRDLINAHAWLAVGNLIVTGGPDVSGFSAFGQSAAP